MKIVFAFVTFGLILTFVIALCGHKKNHKPCQSMEIKVVASSMQALKKSLLNYHIVVDN